MQRYKLFLIRHTKQPSNYSFFSIWHCFTSNFKVGDLAVSVPLPFTLIPAQTAGIILFLKLNADSLSVVINQLTHGIVEVQKFRSISRDKYHIELTILQHSRELTVTLTKGDSARGFVVRDVDGGELTLFVIIVGTFVLVEQELSVLASIDIQVDEFGRLFVTILNLGTKGNDAALADVDRNALVWCIDNQ